MPTYPELYVIRHGQTVWNREHRHQGRLDSPLTGRGRAQARAVAGLLAREIGGHGNIAAFTSPQGRARATAELVLAGTGLTARSDARLCEIAFGAWEGLRHDEILARWPEMGRIIDEEGFNWHFLSPGGETLADLQARTQSFLDDLAGPAVIVTHGVLSRVLRALWLGLDDETLADLPGGQGVIFHLAPEHGQRMLVPEAGDPAAAEA